MNQATEPTLEEIRERAEAIQSEWSPRERSRRAAGLLKHRPGVNAGNEIDPYRFTVPTARYCGSY